MSQDDVIKYIIIIKIIIFITLIHYGRIRKAMTYVDINIHISSITVYPPD